MCVGHRTIIHHKSGSTGSWHLVSTLLQACVFFSARELCHWVTLILARNFAEGLFFLTKHTWHLSHRLASLARSLREFPIRQVGIEMNPFAGRAHFRVAVSLDWLGV